MWRILGFDIQYKSVPVQRLKFHLPGEHTVTYEENESLEEVIERNSEEDSMFIDWMRCNAVYPEAKGLTYIQFPEYFVWKTKDKIWVPRKRGTSVGRLYHVSPTVGEKYYLRLLLNVQPCPTSYADLRTVKDVEYESFKEACQALGLLGDDKEYIAAINEASFWGNGDYLRRMFVTLLMQNCLIEPANVWNETRDILSEGILAQLREENNAPNWKLSEEQVHEHTLVEIEHLMRGYGKSLKGIRGMVCPEDALVNDGMNKLVLDELQFDVAEQAAEFRKLRDQLTGEQKGIYEEIMSAVDSNKGGVYFLYGYGGTGKTFLWRTLSSSIRSGGNIVLTVASSGIAALLLPMGRTAHSRFAIPIKLDESSSCSVKPNDPLTELLWKAKLIIWDEAPMVHKHCFEALDRTLKDILRKYDPECANQPFGGKVVVFGGDFRKILPVVQQGSGSQIVHAAINASHIWQYCKVLRLTVNMRLASNPGNDDAEELKEFADWILSIGDGTLGGENDGEAEIQIPEEFLVKCGASKPLDAIATSTYPDLLENITNVEYLQERAILAPTNEIVEEVNNSMLSLLPREEEVYLSDDSICKGDKHAKYFDEELYSPEYLNSIRCSGLPNHEIRLKVNTPIMLMRNMDASRGLCNGTRLRITKLGKHVIEAEIISSFKRGTRVFIPRLNLTPSDMKLPFRLTRRQFPISVSFAMTINKSQGQSLKHVGIYLPKQVFGHGQLYVGSSRVTNKKGLRFMITDEEGRAQNHTTNVVYKEVFRNL